MTFKNKINYSIIILLLLGASLVGFLIYPLYEEIQGASQEMIFQKQKLIALESKIKNIEEFRKNHTKIKESLKKTEDLFINSEAPVDFIYFLEETSQICQVPIEISPSGAKQEGGDSWVSIGFRISSSSYFPNFLRFLEKLESAPYLININGLSINALSEKELLSKGFESAPFGYVQASLSIKVFAN
jgi:hypothetical protein